jgi:hypothetical protein
LSANCATASRSAVSIKGNGNSPDPFNLRNVNSVLSPVRKAEILPYFARRRSEIVRARSIHEGGLGMNRVFGIQKSFHARQRTRNSRWNAVIVLVLCQLLVTNACFSGDTRDARTRADDPKRDEPFEYHSSCFRGQEWIWLTSSSLDCMCLADQTSFHNSRKTLSLTGDVLIGVKGCPKLYTGEVIDINVVTGDIAVIRPLSHKSPGPAKTRADELWEKYQVEFLVRTGRSIEVVTRSLSKSDQFPFLINGMTSDRVREQRALFGKSDVKAHDIIHLFPAPPPDTDKVFLVDYHGNEDRNWLPYDKGREEKILTFCRERNIR